MPSRATHNSTHTKKQHTPNHKTTDTHKNTQHTQLHHHTHNHTETDRKWTEKVNRERERRVKCDKLCALTCCSQPTPQTSDGQEPHDQDSPGHYITYPFIFLNQLAITYPYLGLFLNELSNLFVEHCTQDRLVRTRRNIALFQRSPTETGLPPGKGLDPNEVLCSPHRSCKSTVDRSKIALIVIEVRMAHGEGSKQIEGTRCATALANRNCCSHGAHHIVPLPRQCQAPKSLTVLWIFCNVIANHWLSRFRVHL